MNLVPSRNLVLAASAGTGKTHALVGAVLHWLVRGSSQGGVPEPVFPSRVVATTFSRKAAAEIRARVTRELERLSAAPATSLYADALRADDLSDATLASRAGRALSRLDMARIGTLHGFAMGIVRDHAVELGLGAKFDLATEAEHRARVQDAVARALERRLARDVSGTYALVDAAGGVDALVDELRRVLGQLEEDGRSARDLAIAEGDRQAVDDLLETLAHHARELTAVPKFSDEATAFLAAWASGDDARVEAALIPFAMLDARLKHEAVRAFGAFRGALPGKSNLDKGRRLARLFLARASFEGRARDVRELLIDAEDELHALARASASLGFGQILGAARDLLRDHPDVAEEIASGIDALLVDEFQDTSRVQCELLQLLWARPGERHRGQVPKLDALRPAGLLVVGDRKQSIYGFRGADVGVFAELAVGLAGEPARVALGVPKRMIWEPVEPLAEFRALRHNRRGEGELLTFANAFSARRFVPDAPAPAIYEIAYVPETEELCVPPERARSQGLTPSPRKRTTWLRISPKRKTSSRIEEALVIAARIRQIVESGTPLVEHGRRVPSFRDVAVLATSNAMLDAVAFALAQAGVPHVVAGRSFFRTREVRDLAAMLALMIDPEDRVAALTVLRGPWASVHDETLLGLVRTSGGLCRPEAWTTPPNPTLVRQDDVQTLGEVAALVAELNACVARIGPGAALREAVRQRRLEEVLAVLPRGHQRVANVRKLLAMADRQPDPRALLDALDGAVDDEIAEAEAATFSEADDAVRLLTIHASKGLDFPIVFIPEIAKTVPPGPKGTVRVVLGDGDTPNRLSVRIADPDGVLLEPPSFTAAEADARRRNRAERQRLAYVAATRAADAMFFVGGTSAPPKDADAGVTTLGALELLAADPDTAAAACFAVEDVQVPAPSLRGADAVMTTELLEARAEEPVALPVRVWRSLAIAPTALADFAHCARRFELIHVLGFPERLRGRLPDKSPRERAPSLDARTQGTLAHAVLERVPVSAFAGEDAERAASAALTAEGIPAGHDGHAAIVGRVLRFLEGDYARRIVADRGEVHREVAFVLEVSDPEGRRVVLRGSMDLVVRWPDGSLDVVDYKSGRHATDDGDAKMAGPYAFQLDVYAVAARSLFPDATRVRVGLVFLGAGSVEPAWCPTQDETAFRAQISELAARLVAARWSGAFPRGSRARCDEIHCGHIGRCHGVGTGGTDENASRVTTT